MVSKALLLMKTVFESCVEWFGQLLDAVDGAGLLIAAFIVVLVVSLFLMPLRGGGVTVGGFQDFVNQATYTPRYTSSGKALRNKISPRGKYEYKGKFEKRAHGGRRGS